MSDRSAYMRDWAEQNREHLRAYQRAWRKKNSESYSDYWQKRRETDKYRVWRRQYVNGRRKTDLQFKLANILRHRIKEALKGRRKSGSAVALLGTSIEGALRAIEKKFLPGMTWENWASDGWHLDHIKPLSAFDLTHPEQLAQACHISNLQPLWWQENIKKRHRDDPHR